MELDQEKQNQEAAERCRALAQRIVRELAPRSVQVLEDSGLLEKAFCKMNTAVVQSAPELLVVADPQWVTLPAVQAEKVLLVCAEYAGMADCAKQLAAQGFCRELAWKDRGKEQLTALFCRMDAPELPELENGYEQQLDVLRERTLLAERTAAQQTAQLERLRSDLSLSRSHEQELEKTLNSVVNSTFWKASWPLRYLVSKCRQLWRTFPLFVFFATLRRVGFAGVKAQAKAKKEYKKLFPGKAMPADRFADVELLVKQAADQPAAPRISIVVPLYNTPHDFTDIVIRQHHGAPRKTLAVLSAVDPQFLGELISPALLQRICKGQAGHRLELVSPKSHHTLPEVFFAGILPQRNHSPVVSLPLCPGTDIRRFSFLREVHAFLIRQIRGHRGAGQLQSGHSGGDSSRIALCFSEGIKGLLDELCRVRLVDPGCDEQLPNLDRVEGQCVRDGLQAHFVRIKVSSCFHLLCQVLGCTVLWL